jgi:hypothetical protein
MLRASEQASSDEGRYEVIMSIDCLPKGVGVLLNRNKEK